MASRKLIWARHGEAEGQSPAGDKLRALTPRGHKQAQSLARQLQNLGWIPQIIFCSTATRTQETMQELLQIWGKDIPCHIEDTFYLGSLENAQFILDQHDLSHCETVLLVGHNPGWSSAAQQLSGDSVSLNTADAALVSHDSDDWSSALQASFTWTLHQVLRN